MRRIRDHARGSAVFLAAAAVIVLGFFLMPATVSAEQSPGANIGELNNDTILHTTLENGKTYILTEDLTNLTQLVVDSDIKSTIHMNGYALDGVNLASIYDPGNTGIVVNKNAQLTIDGSCSDPEHHKHPTHEMHEWDVNFFSNNRGIEKTEKVTGSAILNWSTGIRLEEGADLIVKDTVIGGNVLTAIDAAGNNRITLTNCTIALTSGDKSVGGIHIEGDNCILNLRGTTIRDNQNENTTTGAGIYIKGNSCALNLHETTIRDNNNINDGKGGGIYIKGNNCSVHGSNEFSPDTYSRIYNNSGGGSGDGGGIYAEGDGTSIQRLKLNGNTAGRYGAGICLIGNNCSVVDVQCVECTLLTEEGDAVYTRGNNNLITNVSSYCDDSNRTVSLVPFSINGENNMVYGCSSSGSKKSGFFINGDYNTLSESSVKMNREGGNIEIRGDGNKVLNCVVDGSSYNCQYGKGIYNRGERTRISGCTFLSCGALYAGGAIFSSEKDTYVEKSSFYDCKAITKSLFNNGGGAVYLDDSNGTVQDCTFTNCAASASSGGAIYADGGNARISDCKFTGNKASGSGGAIYFDSSKTEVKNCTFTGNEAGDYGGAIYYDGKDNLLEESTITGNQANEKKNYGHGVYVDDTNLQLSSKVIIKDNGVRDINSIKTDTDDKIPTWSNLCLYDDAELAVVNGELDKGSEVWLDSDWGHYKAPANGYIYRMKNSADLRIQGFKSDRSGYHFTEKSGTLYYAPGNEMISDVTLESPGVSLEPTAIASTPNPGRVYISSNSPYPTVKKDYVIERSENNGERERIEVKTDADGNDYVDLYGAKEYDVTYYFTLSCKLTKPLPGGGTKTFSSAVNELRYTINASDPGKAVLMKNAAGQEVYMGTFSVGEEQTLTAPEKILPSGYHLTEAVMYIEGDEAKTPVEIDQKNNQVTFTIPENTPGRTVYIETSSAVNTYQVTFGFDPAEAESSVNKYMLQPKMVTDGLDNVLTLGNITTESGDYRIDSVEINGQKQDYSKAFSFLVREDAEIIYHLAKKDTVTVTYDDPKGILKGEEKYKRGNSYQDQKGGTTSGLYELTTLQVGVPDESGTMTFSDELTISVTDPIRKDMTLRPVWHYTVPVIIDSNYCTVSAPRTGNGYGYYTDGDTAQINYEPSITTGKVPCGWEIYRFETSVSNPFGVTYSLSEDKIQTTEKTSVMKGLAICEANADGIQFNIKEEMGEPTKSGRRVYISVKPTLTDPVTDITNVPESLDLNRGEIFSFSEAAVLPEAKGREITWTLRDGSDSQTLTNSFIPTKAGNYTLSATVKNGLGLGKDYRKTFQIEVTAEHIHALQEIPAKEATCKEQGNAAYWFCTECGEVFEDAEGAVPVGQSDTIIQPLGHDWGEGQEADNDGECGGRVLNYVCSRCGEERTVAKEGTGTHTPGEQPRQEIIASPSCGKAGIAENIWTCEDCGMIVKTETAELPASGHNWGEAEYRIIGNLDKVEAKRFCANDPGHIEKEIADITVEKEGDLLHYSAHFNNEAFSWSFEDDGQRGGASADYAKTHIVLAHDGTWVGSGASVMAANKQLTSWKADRAPAGAAEKPLMLKASKKTQKSVKLKWKKAKGTKRYVIYGGKKGQKLKKIATTSKTKYTVKKIGKKKLTKKTNYRFVVIALDQFNFVNTTSKMVKAKTK